MKSNWKSIALSAVMGAGLLLTPGAALAGQESAGKERIAAMGKPEEHAKMAREYRLRGEALEARAAEHEKRAAEMRKSSSPMAHKWPAMVRNDWRQESQRAIQARRAAQECYEMASQHVNLAVEAQADVE